MFTFSPQSEIGGPISANQELGGPISIPVVTGFVSTKTVDTFSRSEPNGVPGFGFSQLPASTETTRASQNISDFRRAARSALYHRESDNVLHGDGNDQTWLTLDTTTLFQQVPQVTSPTLKVNSLCSTGNTEDDARETPLQPGVFSPSPSEIDVAGARFAYVERITTPLAAAVSLFEPFDDATMIPSPLCASPSPSSSAAHSPQAGEDLPVPSNAIIRPGDLWTSHRALKLVDRDELGGVKEKRYACRRDARLIV